MSYDSKSVEEIRENTRHNLVFMMAFYHQHILQDDRRAKELYRTALERGECPMECFQMLANLLLNKYKKLRSQTID